MATQYTATCCVSWSARTRTPCSLMLTPAAKRRRAAAASATLARPFRSPVVRSGSPSKTDSASPERKRKRSARQGQQEERKEEQKQKPPIALSGLMDQFTRDLDAGDRFLQESGAGALQSARPPSAQAAGGGDLELRALITRWRAAARIAAEEVFAIVSERVDRAGGVKAWRAMTGSGWDGENQHRPPSDGEQDEQEEAPQEEEEEFTMTMMLASLHVDAALLGYDAAEERWIDEDESPTK